MKSINNPLCAVKTIVSLPHFYRTAFCPVISVLPGHYLYLPPSLAIGKPASAQFRNLTPRGRARKLVGIVWYSYCVSHSFSLTRRSSSECKRDSPSKCGPPQFRRKDQVWALVRSKRKLNLLNTVSFTFTVAELVVVGFDICRFWHSQLSSIIVLR